MKKIGLLGSTGSIGTQTMDVIRKNIELYEVVFISGHRNIELLNRQCLEFKPEFVVITDRESYNKAKLMK